MRRISLGGEKRADGADAADGADRGANAEHPRVIASAEGAKQSGGEPATAPSGEPIAADPSGPRDDGSPRRRVPFLRPLLYVVALVAIFVIGWLGSALWFSPAPLLPEERTVPSIVGLPLTDARTSVERAELRIRADDRRTHPTAPRGVVIWQDPAPGTAVPMNTAVQVATSSGRPTIAVPDLSGLAAPDARVVLEAAGLAVGGIDTVPGQGERDVVLGTRPGPGTGRTAGARIELIVTAGDPPAERFAP